jgi:hypothetical protein
MFVSTNSDILTQRMSAPNIVMRAKMLLTLRVPGIVAAEAPADEELPEEVTLSAVEVVVAAEPRAKVGELKFAFADNVTAEPLATTDGARPTRTAADEDVVIADIGSMRLAADLTHGMPVLGGISVVFEVKVALLFVGSYTTCTKWRKLSPRITTLPKLVPVSTAEGIEGAFGSAIRKVSRLAIELTNQEEGTLIFGPLDPPNW